MSPLATADFLDQLFAFLEPDKVDAIARETGFIQRKRVVTASDFLALLFQVQGNLMDCTLQELCFKLTTEQDISISRAALDKKFTMNAVHFLHRLVEELCRFQHQLLPEGQVHNLPFTSIRILDATAASVPDHLKARAQKTRQTSVKIQYEFDLLTGRFTFFCLDRQNINDAVIGAKRVPFLEGQELCLQDLGYFHFKVFEGIQHYGSYFLTKFRSDAYLAYRNPFPNYHPNGDVVASSQYHRIDLAGLCRNMAPGEVLELEEVHFGRDAHFPARCILLSHDDAQRQVRLGRIQRRATKSGKKPKQLVQDLAGITGYMTNLPESVSEAQVVELYRLRWQIELSFKILKSYLAIDHFKLVKQERWLCHVYGIFLVFLLSQLMAYRFRNAIWEEEEQEISEMVAIRSIGCGLLAKLYEAFRQKKKTPQAFVHLITRLLIRTARKPASAKGTAMKRLHAM